jgi:septal ring factor EnvC (AmiA/AmiB activator)
MDNFDRAQRDWETPPDEDDAIFNEVTWDEPYFKCTNIYCPSKYISGLFKDMANHLVEVEQSLKDTQNTLKYVRRKLAWTNEVLSEREETIEKLEKKITALEFRRDEGE